MIYPWLIHLRLGFLPPAQGQHPAGKCLWGLTTTKYAHGQQLPGTASGRERSRTILSHHPHVRYKTRLVAAGDSAEFAVCAGRAIYRTLIFTTILSFVLVGFIWTLILTPCGDFRRFFMRLAEIRDGFWNLMGPTGCGCEPGSGTARTGPGLSQGSFCGQRLKNSPPESRPWGQRNTACQPCR